MMFDFFFDYTKVGLTISITCYFLLSVFTYKFKRIPKDQFVGIIAVIFIWPIFIVFLFFPNLMPKRKGDEDGE